ncbi:MAG TPA: hypothetical protein DHV48_03615 [Prolixibacteraceae bacterium]|nr:hypothetical protein [Prolixibacteraceae bacterium]
MTTKQRFYFRSFAAGGSPDPAVYCPANGYLPPYTYFESPIEVTTVSSESIVFILDTDIGFVLDKMTVGSDISCNVIFDFYDETDTLIGSGSQAVTGGSFVAINQTIPASTSQYVKCIATLSNGSAVFNKLYSNISTISTAGIVAIFANTPNLAGSVNFRAHIALKKVEFLSTLNYVSDMNYLFSLCGVEKFTMPVSMPALTSMQYCIYYSTIKEFIFPPGFSAPLLTDIFAFGRNSTKITSFVLPNIPSLLQINLLFYLSTIKSLTITTGTNLDTVSQILEGNTEIEEIELPSFPIFTTGTRLFYGCTNLKKITLNGIWAKTSNDWLANCSLLRELHYPRTLSAHLSSLTNTTTIINLSILHVPDYFNFDATLSQMNYYFFLYTGTVANKIKKVYGDAEFATGDLPLLTYNATYYKQYLEEVNLPKLRVSKISIGTNSTTFKMQRLSVLAIDWANSSYSGTSPQIQLAAPLDATWLNAMFTALPTVTSKTIDVRYCDGYATCDPTIATAKGWTVL